MKHYRDFAVRFEKLGTPGVFSNFSKFLLKSIPIFPKLAVTRGFGKIEIDFRRNLEKFEKTPGVPKANPNGNQNYESELRILIFFTKILISRPKYE